MIRIKPHIKSLLAAALIVGIVSLMIACAPSTSRIKEFLFQKLPKSSQTPRNVLVWGTVNPPTIINPNLTSHSISAALIPLIFDSLVRIGPNGDVLPGFAKSWTVSPNGLVYTFTLNEGVRFHDGVECTSADVLFTFEEIMRPSSGSIFRSIYPTGIRFKAPSRYIFQIILEKPFFMLLQKCNRYIMPKHLLENKAPKEVQAFNIAPKGTGPFRLKSWDHQSGNMRLVANGDYFESKPKLEGIDVHIYENNQQLWAAMLRQEVDFVKFLNFEDYLILTKDPAFKAYAVASRMVFSIEFNIHDPVWSDKELRKAVCYALDVEELMRHLGVNSTTEVRLSVRNFYNPTRAKMMLAARGWVDADGNGVLEKNSKELELRLIVNTSQKYYETMAKDIRQQLSTVGIRIVLVEKSNEDKPSQEFMQRYKPQAWLRMSPSPTLADFEAVSAWYSKTSEYGRLWHYKDDKLDALFEELRGQDDPFIIKRIFNDINNVIVEDEPICYLFPAYTYHAVTGRVRNESDFFTDYMPGYLMKGWSVN